MSSAHIILEATRSASEADIAALRQLAAQYPNTLQVDLLLRILLTYLPETTEPTLYAPFLQDLISESFSATDDKTFLLSHAEEIPEAEARRRVKRLHLAPLQYPPYSSDASIDSFTHFLLHRANQIDAETGSLPLVLQLIDPFIDHSKYLRNWMISTLLPLLRLEYEYYPQKATLRSLEAFERLDGSSAVALLLAEALKEDGGQNWVIARDLRGLVGPWIHGDNRRKRRRLDTERRRTSDVLSLSKDTTHSKAENASGSEWSHVNEWLVGLATRNIAQAVNAIEQWDGPRDVDYGGWDDRREERNETASDASLCRYGQAGLAAIYASEQASLSGVENSHRILNRVAQICGLQNPKELGSAGLPLDAPMIDSSYLDSLSKAQFLRNALLNAQNPLTTPNQFSVDLAQLLLISGRILEGMHCRMTCNTIAALSILGGEAEQWTELRKLLYGLRARTHQDDNAWNATRQQLLWLRDWNYRGDSQQYDDHIIKSGIFCKIGKTEIEHEILKAFLIAGREFPKFTQIYRYWLNVF